MYDEPINTPYRTNSRKDTYTERKNENMGKKVMPQQNKPLIDLQIFEPSMPKKPQRSGKIPAYVPINMQPMSRGVIMNPPMYYPYTPYSYVPNQVPIIKKYNINVGGPDDDHQRVAMIYEDILPRKHFKNTNNTIGERITIHDFIRSVLIRQEDGEHINFSGGGTGNDTAENLLSHIKFLELNPYNTNKFSNNPYMGLPFGVMIYKSCYPIRYHSRGATSICAKNSVGVNIRIYRLSNGEYDINKNNNVGYYMYDIWREIAYYEYIREHIVKRKICPHFVSMYAYFIAINCGFDFEKLSIINNTKIKTEKKNIYNIEIINRKKVKTVTKNMGAYSGHALIALTESPNYNLLGWASRIYQIDNNHLIDIKKMVHTGYHDKKIWYSVLFQLMVSLYVLQINNIYFTNFSVADNVYIKDTNIHGTTTSYWKYIVDGVEYYIPNYGYLVMIDSNFKDIDNGSTNFKQRRKKRQWKIHSKIFDNESNVSLERIKSICFNAFKESLNPNIFSTDFRRDGGVPPPEEISSFLSKIYIEASSGSNKNIGDYITKFMSRFVNNRVGTMLKEDELKNIREDDRVDHRAYKKGKIMVQKTEYGTYKFVIFLEHVDRDAYKGMSKIITRNNKSKEIEHSLVPRGSLINYADYVDIHQNFSPETTNLSEDNLLEVYIINNNNDN